MERKFEDGIVDLVMKGEAMHKWINPRGHNVAVLFSSPSRDAYAQQAAARGQTYTFIDATRQPRTWLKGEYAYLAPNAASLLLARCNIKHDIIDEADLSDERLSGMLALVIPNGGHLGDAVIARIERWIRDPAHRLVVTGKTNLPPRLLGLASCEPLPVAGYTGWRWRESSPFAGSDWEAHYVTGYAGHPAHRVVALPAARVSADLLLTIFTPYSPLHDGAVIIRGDTIIAAGCILPLSQKPLTDRALGTRHRAALGLSDESDALCIVVSEERATVSVAQRGRLRRDLTPQQLREVLETRGTAHDGGEPSEVAG